MNYVRCQFFLGQWRLRVKTGLLTHIQKQMTRRPLLALKYRGASEGW